MEWAQKLIAMGYSADLIGAVIAEQMIYEGNDFKSFKDILMATVEAADMGDGYPVRHYALGLAQNTASSSSEAGGAATSQRLPPTSMSSSSNSILALSTGASSWTETTPSGGTGMNGIETSVRNLDLETRSLETENRVLKEQKICKVCFENDANMVFIPCGHLVVCENCSDRLRECPVCRRPIQGVLKAYLS
jgi:hypothetical protein